jgi:hypothetical protein
LTRDERVGGDGGCADGVVTASGEKNGGIARLNPRRLDGSNTVIPPTMSLRLSRFLVSATLVFAGLTGCSQQDSAAASATAQDIYADAKTTLSHAWDDVKAYSFEKRQEFQASAKSLSAKMDAQVSELRAKYSDAKASASRKLAMEELKNSEIDYRAKLDALGNATAATWDSAKQNVIAAWDKLQAAYQKARSE